MKFHCVLSFLGDARHFDLSALCRFFYSFSKMHVETVPFVAGFVFFHYSGKAGVMGVGSGNLDDGSLRDLEIHHFLAEGFDTVLAAPTEKDDIMELTRNYLELKRDLDAKMDEWASL